MKWHLQLEQLEQRLCLTELAVQSFGSDSQLDILMSYEVSLDPAPSFEIGLYQSDDKQFDVSDVQIGARTLIDSPSLQSVGGHQVSLDSKALREAITDFEIPFILAVVDPDYVVSEADKSDNSDYFVGVTLDHETVAMRGRDSAVGDVFAFAPQGVGARLHFNGSRVTIADPVSTIRAMGNAGRDVMRSTTGYTVDLQLLGGAGNDQLIGGSGDDSIDGGAGGDVINGFRGNDFITGDGLSFTSGSRDIIFGHDGDDTIEGGSGDDRIVGMAGRDILLGGDGNDALLGRDGDDILFGNDGDDILLGGRNNDRMSGDRGADKLYGVGGNDTLTGGQGIDVLRGGFQDDELNGSSVFLEDLARDHIFGEQGTDTVSGLRDRLDRVVRRQMEIDIRRDSPPDLGPPLWQNPVNPLDVNDDGDVTLEDVESIVRRFYTQIPLSVPPNFIDNPPPYYDINGDNFLSSDDIDLLIDELRKVP